MTKKFVGIDYSHGKDSTVIMVFHHTDGGEVEILREFDDEDDFIHWLFNGRCVGIDKPCHKLARDVSHIIPRSSGESSKGWKNKVLHCVDCHNEYHRNGTSDEAIKNLQERRIEYLEAIGREDFI